LYQRELRGGTVFEGKLKGGHLRIYMQLQKGASSMGSGIGQDKERLGEMHLYVKKDADIIWGDGRLETWQERFLGTRGIPVYEGSLREQVKWVNCEKQSVNGGGEGPERPWTQREAGGRLWDAANGLKWIRGMMS